MRYYLDTEFNGFGGELMSLALVPSHPARPPPRSRPTPATGTARCAWGRRSPRTSPPLALGSDDRVRERAGGRSVTDVERDATPRQGDDEVQPLLPHRELGGVCAPRAPG